MADWNHAFRRTLQTLIFACAASLVCIASTVAEDQSALLIPDDFTNGFSTRGILGVKKEENTARKIAIHADGLCITWKNKEDNKCYENSKKNKYYTGKLNKLYVYSDADFLNDEKFVLLRTEFPYLTKESVSYHGREMRNSLHLGADINTELVVADRGNDAKTVAINFDRPYDQRFGRFLVRMRNGSFAAIVDSSDAIEEYKRSRWTKVNDPDGETNILHFDQDLNQIASWRFAQNDQTRTIETEVCPDRTCYIAATVSIDHRKKKHEVHIHKFSEDGQHIWTSKLNLKSPNAALIGVQYSVLDYWGRLPEFALDMKIEKSGSRIFVFAAQIVDARQNARNKDGAPNLKNSTFVVDLSSGDVSLLENVPGLENLGLEPRSDIYGSEAALIQNHSGSVYLIGAKILSAKTAYAFSLEAQKPRRFEVFEECCLPPRKAPGFIKAGTRNRIVNLRPTLFARGELSDYYYFVSTNSSGGEGREQLNIFDFDFLPDGSFAKMPLPRTNTTEFYDGVLLTKISPESGSFVGNPGVHSTINEESGEINFADLDGKLIARGFTGSGQSITQFFPPGISDAQMELPGSMCGDGSGKIYSCERKEDGGYTIVEPRDLAKKIASENVAARELESDAEAEAATEPTKAKVDAAQDRLGELENDHKRKQSKMRDRCACLLPGDFCLTSTPIDETREEREARERARARSKKLCLAWWNDRDIDEAKYLARSDTLRGEYESELENLRQQERAQANSRKQALARYVAEQEREAEQLRAKISERARAAREKMRQYCKEHGAKDPCACARFDKQFASAKSPKVCPL
ncbi:MAG: hypothetical protein R8J41_00380 [Alphaproteobacteria bacterium]|nr:hypothetical protein [Alphaproteobacteria bacterium]